MTTIAGQTISGSGPPRFSTKRIAEAQIGLRDRIKANNADRNAPFRVTEAVAFGDFLLEQSLAQAADVGIALARTGHGRVSDATETASLRRLRGHRPIPASRVLSSTDEQPLASTPDLTPAFFRQTYVGTSNDL